MQPLIDFKDKTYLITGVANKKSIAYFVAKSLLDQQANVILTVQNEELREKVQTLFPQTPIHLCDVEQETQVQALGTKLSGIKLDGMLHSLAFAKLSNKPFHETPVVDFLQAAHISCYSLTSLSNALKKYFTNEASVATVTISDTKATAYGYMGPIKAALQASVAYLAKSFSEFSQVRFNAVGAGPLKTSASAGIPGYVENYLYAEKLTLRKENLKTQEVANTILFLLSDLSTGINASEIIVDAGMRCNTFDERLVQKACH